MGYKKRRATLQWWDPHTKKIKYFLSANFDKHNNKFGKGWSQGSELMIGTNTYTLTTLNMYLSYHLFIKDDIFEVNVNFPPGVTPIGILTQYCEHRNMSYIFQ